MLHISNIKTSHLLVSTVQSDLLYRIQRMYVGGFLLYCSIWFIRASYIPNIYFSVSTIFWYKYIFIVPIPLITSFINNPMDVSLPLHFCFVTYLSQITLICDVLYIWIALISWFQEDHMPLLSFMLASNKRTLLNCDFEAIYLVMSLCCWLKVAIKNIAVATYFHILNTTWPWDLWRTILGNIPHCLSQPQLSVVCWAVYWHRVADQTLTV